MQVGVILHLYIEQCEADVSVSSVSATKTLGSAMSVFSSFSFAFSETGPLAGTSAWEEERRA